MILDAIASKLIALAGINTTLRDPAAAVLSYGLIDATTNEAGLYIRNGVLYNKDGAAILNFAVPLAGTGIQALSGAGAVDLINSTTEVTSTGSNALTLADGTPGQVKIVTMIVDGGDATLTPTTKTGFSTVVFGDVGDSVILQFHTTKGWMVISNVGATVS